MCAHRRKVGDRKYARERFAPSLPSPFLIPASDRGRIIKYIGKAHKEQRCAPSVERRVEHPAFYYKNFLATK